MTHVIAFALGAAAGAGLLLWLIGRSIATAIEPEKPVPAWVHDEDALPPDPYIRDLADILRRERW